VTRPGDGVKKIRFGFSVDFEVRGGSNAWNKRMVFGNMVKDLVSWIVELMLSARFHQN
jgi:hypothetical protein